MPLFPILFAAVLSAPHVWWIPSAGRTIGAGGREFSTTLSITNESNREARVTISFFPAAKPGKEPRSIELSVPARGMLAHQFGPGLEQEGESAGALRVSSSDPLSIETRVSSRNPAIPDSAVGATYSAIDASAAIGTAEKTRLVGPAPGSRYTLHVAETTGYPLTMIATMNDGHGRITGSKRLYLGAHEQRSWSLAGEFAQLQLGGLSGSGRVVAVATEILPGSQDIVAHEMTRKRLPRHRIPGAEAAAYLSIALAVAASAYVTRRNKTAT